MSLRGSAQSRPTTRITTHRKGRQHVLPGLPRCSREEDRQDAAGSSSTRPPPAGYGPTTKAGVVVDWLKEEYGVGRGHAMALYGVIKNGPVAPEKHVGSTGVHRDESATLRLDGIAARS